MATILLATTNHGKVRELEHLMPSEHRIVVLTQSALEPPEETGTTLAENAAIKALAAHRVTGLIAVGDDSGLEVDALQGAPGVRSARFAGEPADDQRNIEKLLDLLRDVPPEQRSARFRCSVAVAFAGTIVARHEGECEGRIVDTPRGTNGFGYDPVFLLPEGRSMAELNLDEKNRVSHRAAAFGGIAPAIRILAESVDAAEASA